MSDIAALERNINALGATEFAGVSSSPSLSLTVTSSPTSTGSQTGTDSIISTSSSSTVSSPSASGTGSPRGSSSETNSKSTNTLAIGLGVGLGILTLLCLACGGILFFRMRKKLRLLEDGRNAHPIMPEELGEGKGEMRAEVQGMEVGKPLHELEGERAVEIG